MALTPEVKAARKKGIGGSDVAVILGLSPWKQPYELYLEKRGEIDEVFSGDTELQHFGHVLEDVVAQEYVRRNNVKVERRNKMIKHPGHKFMLANIDRKVVGVKKGLECKTADKFTIRNWGEQGSDEIPDYYRTQVEHYMIVTDYPEWDLAVLIGGNEYRDYHIERDPELSELIIEAECKFWENVVKGKPPEIDFDHDSTQDLLKRMHPGTNGKTIELPSELVHWHETKVQAEALIKTYQGVVDGCKARIMAALGDNACGTFSQVGYQYKRSLVKKKPYKVEASEYFQMRGSQYKFSGSLGDKSK